MSSQSLKKEISLRQLFALSFGSIVGVGWITVMGAWLAGAGVLGAALAFFAGAVLVVLISFCYAELATRFPATGGEIVYIHEIFGLRASFIVGWLLAMAYVSIVIFEVISVGWVISALLPDLQGPVLYSVGGTDVTLLGLGSGVLGMGIIAWFNIRGAKSAATLQEVMSFLLVLVTLVFCVFAFVRGDVANFDPYFVTDSNGLIWTGIAAVLITAPFFYSGFDVIPQAMGEKSETASMRAIPIVLVLSILAAGAFYVFVILAAGIAMPREELLASDLPMADAIAAALGSSVGGQIVLFAGLLGLITSWNSFTYGGARVLFALGRGKIIFSVFGEVDETRKTPVKAILFISLAGIVGGLFGRSAVLPVVDAGSFAFIFVYTAVCFAAFWCGLRPDHKEQSMFTAPGGTFTRGFTVLLTMAMTGYALYLPYQSAGGEVPAEWLIFASWIVVGAILYFVGAGARSRTSTAERSRLLLTDVTT